MTLRLKREEVLALHRAGRISLTEGEQAELGVTGKKGRTRAGRRPALGNRYVRSSWEASFMAWLIVMKDRGDILSWEYEPKVFWFEGITRGTRSYTPDFRVVYPDGSGVWYEIKGWLDPKSKTRLKRMKRYYPNEQVEIIGREWFVRMEHSGVAGAIPGWERMS